MNRHIRVLIIALSTFLGSSNGLLPEAQAASPRPQYQTGMSDLAKARRDARRDIVTRYQYRPDYRSPSSRRWQTERERRFIRREIRREIRRRYYGRVVAGVVLGTVIGVAVAGRPPRRPSDELCWYWTSDRSDRGYWYYCEGD